MRQAPRLLHALRVFLTCVLLGVSLGAMASKPEVAPVVAVLKQADAEQSRVSRRSEPPQRCFHTAQPVRAQLRSAPRAPARPSYILRHALLR